MTTIIPFLQKDAFDPDALRAMSTALEEVSRTLQLDGDQRAREVIAVRIIELARRGERDPERLRDRVLQEAGATPSVVPADLVQRSEVDYRGFALPSAATRPDRGRVYTGNLLKLPPPRNKRATQSRRPKGSL
jgi:hypothetical protein